MADERFDAFRTEEDVKKVFQSQPVNDEQLKAMAAVQEAATAFGQVLRLYVHPCADRTAALRHIRDAAMTATYAISHNGLI